ncbi:hypothetical protein PS2_129 [Serratia phage PS2]|uniref:Uncharacterized protein n=1 Tax=Serratia phage PS2 TaxID=1481112 RepID=A0A023W540_9CAUD|nr:hypothetical protein FF83_gp129 [Serratia phage PS2]AHY25375.1 hypothetical protein PS2_129 [Serratia phage PS2]
MAIAICIKSESCDKYIYAYDTGTPVETIKEELLGDMDMFAPICEWEYSVSQSSMDVNGDIDNMMSGIFDASWEGR